MSSTDRTIASDPADRLTLDADAVDASDVLDAPVLNFAGAAAAADPSKSVEPARDDLPPDAAPDDPILSVSTTRSLRRWLSKTCDERAEQTGDAEWHEVSTHDLRRTWATALADTKVDTLLALDWGGWEDLETFLQQYRWAHSPAAKRRARERIRRL